MVSLNEKSSLSPPSIPPPPHPLLCPSSVSFMLVKNFSPLHSLILLPLLLLPPLIQPPAPAFGPLEATWPLCSRRHSVWRAQTPAHGLGLTMLHQPVELLLITADYCPCYLSPLRGLIRQFWFGFFVCLFVCLFVCFFHLRTIHFFSFCINLILLLLLLWRILLCFLFCFLGFFFAFAHTLCSLMLSVLAKSPSLQNFYKICCLEMSKQRVYLWAWEASSNESCKLYNMNN